MNQPLLDDGVRQDGRDVVPIRRELALVLRLIALILAGSVMIGSLTLLNILEGTLHLGGWVSLLGLGLGIGVLWQTLERIHAGAVVIDWYRVSFNRLPWQRTIAWSSIKDVQVGNEIELVLLDGTRLVSRGRLIADHEREQTWLRIQSRWRAWRLQPEMSLPGGGFQLDADRLSLRPWKDGEWPIFHRIYNDADLIRWQLYERTPAWQTRRRFHDQRDAISAARVYGWSRAIVSRELAEPSSNGQGPVVGHMDTWVSSVSRRRVACGYGIFEEYRGRGYATEALESLCSEALLHWGIDAIDATCFAENSASQRVLAKAGFRCWTDGSRLVQKQGKKMRLDAYVTQAENNGASTGDSVSGVNETGLSGPRESEDLPGRED